MVGELCVTVLARALGHALFGARSWRREAIGVSLHQVRLEPALRRQPLHALGSVWVEVELLGVASKKSQLLSAPVHREAEQSVLELGATIEVRVRVRV